MLSEYITSLADVSFHIVAYLYSQFRYSGKNPMRFAVFWCISVRFCGFAFFGPLTPPSVKIPTGLEKTVHAVTGVRYLLTCSEDSLFCVTRHLPP